MKKKISCLPHHHHYLFCGVPNPITVFTFENHNATIKTTTVWISVVDISWRFTKTTIFQPYRWVSVCVATPLRCWLHSSAAGVGEKRRMGRTSNWKVPARAILYTTRPVNVERAITEEMYDEEYLILINESRWGVVGLRPLTMEMGNSTMEGWGWMWRRS